MTKATKKKMPKGGHNSIRSIAMNQRANAEAKKAYRPSKSSSKTSTDTVPLSVYMNIQTRADIKKAKKISKSSKPKKN